MSDNFKFDYGDSNRYIIKEAVGKGSYGVVYSAYDTKNKENVAIKRINNVFEHISDGVRILREIKLLRHLKHPDIVTIKDIILPPSPKDFRDIYVVFELMETDLHQVIRANDDLTDEHHQYLLFQMLRGLKFIHSARVFHRDLKPKNILANSDCKLKICDFGLARPQFTDQAQTIFWTDYVATRWYRAPELCGSFFTKYSPMVDVWSIGCIFAELLLGKPLFPGKNVVNQLELITDLLGTPKPETVKKIRNERARRYLEQLPHKDPADMRKVFPMASQGATDMIKKLLAFDQDDRISASDALEEPYFKDLFKSRTEDIAKPLSKLDYGFDQKSLRESEIRDLMFREILEYHPDAKKQFMSTNSRHVYHFPSQVDRFKMQFVNLDNKGSASGSGQGIPGPPIRSATSMPKQGLSSNLVERALMSNSALSTSFTGATFDQAQELIGAENSPLSQSFSMGKNSYLGESIESELDLSSDSFMKMTLDAKERESGS
ncbi:mitogen-activated protein kinase [Chloropicon primus]|uniref:Mitogen-activated protein kinase n=1 Tax=Chloropicon primus TaxID=1764295 RepID=A0A5B8MJK5_9CHLO|nr:mitogen-activated protein kinase [Chloropicon primus]UPQ99473.1 mitogen-activated protein kinase [Chloropicon primus]|mmetsp:Transcript_8577/g.24530  ORF Transcript_8577/g.24530 Transcript_8577/m.24530 type:complete len:491 (-) Transcript_8577:48-1520(-)|eukprot:QDZ20264.1 mitogen-activated protein kinase [Chloropicon primus]